MLKVLNDNSNCEKLPSIKTMKVEIRPWVISPLYLYKNSTVMNQRIWIAALERLSTPWSLARSGVPLIIHRLILWPKILKRLLKTRVAN
jgi:hypothetical protein